MRTLIETMNDKVHQLQDEMFSVIKSAGQEIGPRLGRLALPGRSVLETPHYLGNTSRGIVPHITQDAFRRDTNISGVYVALEDFIERAPQEIPPLYKFRPPTGASPLRRFIALPHDALLVVGARRTPPIISPTTNSNTDTTISVSTQVGFRLLKPDDYAEGVEGLEVDIVIGLGDIPFGRALGNKRVEKATDRMIQWMRDHVALRENLDMEIQAKLFAPLLPVSCANQQFYIDCLTEDLASDITGLAFYSLDAVEDLPHSLAGLPRLGLTTPSSPHEVLQQVGLGMDVLTVPFVNVATDAGIALGFEFPKSMPSPENGAIPLPLGIDMWSASHAISLSPLSKGCQCYACTNHHRAYIQHLLAAKEMLGWVLLQIHNHQILDLFFQGIRESIARDTFERDKVDFSKAYESRLPAKTGQGPRVRGYQYKAEGPGEKKKNRSPFQMLNSSKEALAGSTSPSVSADADDLGAQGFANKEH